MAKGSARGNAPDISELGLAELRELRRVIDERIVELEAETQRSVYQQIQELVAGAGTTVERLLAQFGNPRHGQRGTKPEKAEKAAKYRNPENPEQTWSGRGRKPTWLVESLAKGKKLEDLAVK